MTALLAAGAGLVGALLGGLAGGFVVWTAARARWIEREAWYEAEARRVEQLQRWREEAIRRGMAHEHIIVESEARLLPRAESTPIRRVAS